MEQEIEGLRQVNRHIQTGHKSEAIPILKYILKSNRNNQEAWLLLSYCVDKLEDKIYCLKEVLKINPNNKEAKKALEGIELMYKVQPSANQDLLTEITENKNVPQEIAEESSMPNVFSVIGWVILSIGFFAGIGLGNTTSFLEGFNWELAFIVWLSAFFSGMIFFGIGKIIELLVKIVNK